MGVSRQAPGWLTWVLAAGLALVFLGERILPGAPAARLVATGLGVVLVLASAAWRVLSWRRARAAGVAPEARLEGQLALTYAGCVLALVLYFLSTDAGIALLRLDFAQETSRARYHDALQVLWATLVAVSLLPALLAALAPGVRRAAGELLESARVADAFNTGLVIALAGTLLFVVGFVATRRDHWVDLGYFRTASPGTATTATARALKTPLKVLLFFPDASPVKTEVEDYFNKLRNSGARLTIEEHDRLADPQVTTRFDVRDDGTIVLSAGGEPQRLVLPVELDAARAQLRTLDRDVQTRLTQLVRGPRVAYLTVGHGELNDTTVENTTFLQEKQLGGVDALRTLLRMLNYQVKDLGLGSGLGREVPSDAAIVLVLGPRRSFLPEELAALDRYAARGGSLFLALQPRSDFRLGLLEQRLGLRFDGVPLADDQQYVRRRGDRTDRGLILTNRFAGHAAIKTASVAGPEAAALFPDAGRLQPLDSGAVRPTVLMRTLPSTFLDRNGNYEADGPQDARGEYDLAAAVAEPDSGRALVYADAEMFTDAVLSSLRINASLAADGMRWLGKEEQLSGTTVSEEDVPIEHTRAQDVGWFYSTILGAPALVLLFGLVGVQRRRRPGRRA